MEGGGRVGGYFRRGDSRIWWRRSIKRGRLFLNENERIWGTL